jgi:hypothetical protein
MKKLILSLMILVASAMSASVYAKTIVYEGTIGQYKIHMVVDENFNGYYYYDHRPDSRFKLVKTSKVECTEDDDYYNYCGQGECYAITLQEYAPGTNKNTGEFVGYFVYGRLDGVWIMLYEGTWRNKSNGKTLEFGVYPAN